jgi:hypothetical protein
MGEGRIEHFPDLAPELVRLEVSAIVTFGDHAARAAQQMTTSILVVTITNDLVETGLVASLARPRVKITGMAIIAPELSAKRLKLVRAWPMAVARPVASLTRAGR